METCGIMQTDMQDFRASVREWLEENCPESQRQPIVKEEQIWAGRRRKFHNEEARIWFERMRDRGWTAPEIPSEYGGGGMDAEQLRILKQEMGRIQARPPLYDSGIWLLAPALLEFGNDEQKQRFLPKLVNGELRWCQGYSEPGAGSDLASLQTRCEDRGDHYLVNGTKMWTTYGCDADWIFCLVRTDPQASKHEGISFLLIDLESPGVNVTPINLISGESDFAQTFFDDVKVPKENLVHELNKGWTVAKGLLKHERKFMAEVNTSVVGPSFSLRDVAQDYVGLDENSRLKDEGMRLALAGQEMEMRALALTHGRMYAEKGAGKSDPRLPLILKYVGTETMKRQDEMMTELLGMRGLGWRDDYFSTDEQLSSRTLLFNRALSIAGGTNEIQLNIIAKRALGLPAK